MAKSRFAHLKSFGRDARAEATGTIPSEGNVDMTDAPADASADGLGFTHIFAGKPTLPPEAEERLEALREELATHHDRYRRLSDERQEAIQEAQRARSIFETSEHARNADLRNADGTTQRYGPDHPLWQSKLAQIEKLDAKAKAIGEKMQAVEQATAPLARLVGNIETYLRSASGLVLAGPPKQAKGATIDKLRDARLDLEGRLEQIRVAPFPLAEVKAKIAREVDELARAGEPSISGVLDHMDPIRWPMKNLQLRDFTAGAHVTGAAPDSLALLAWLHRDAVVARLNALADEMASDDEGAVPTAERGPLEMKLRAEILANEIQEAALIWAAGDLSLFRPGADPRAALLVTGPAPTEA